MTRKCRICKETYKPTRGIQPTCGKFDCEVEYANSVVEKKARKEEKAARIKLAQMKEEAKPVKKHLKETEKVINKYVRVRDFYEGCISCDKPSHWDGQWHASHFKSVGSNSVLRFHLWNIHKGCSECNRHRAGNIEQYRARLELKHGKERTEWLDSQNGVKKYTAEYLIRMKKIFSKKTRRAEQRLNLLKAGE